MAATESPLGPRALDLTVRRAKYRTWKFGIDAKLHVLSFRELADRQAEGAEERAAFQERHPEWNG